MVPRTLLIFAFEFEIRQVLEFSASRTDARPLGRLRMTLEFFIKVSATMMRSYFVKGNKQKFGSTLSTVIDVRMHCSYWFWFVGFRRYC